MRASGERRVGHARDALHDLGHDLGPRAVRRGRMSGRTRLGRLRRRGWQIAQCSVAAAVAWFIASDLVGHDRPFFAPVAAVVALGVSYEARLRRTGEVVVGVALGIAVGDLFVSVAGTGTWQIALVIGIAMCLAVLLDGGTLLVTQAGVQAAIVATLLPRPADGLDRWVDAVIGGGVALVAAAIVPASPLRRPRQLAASLLDDLADVLHAAAEGARTGDRERAQRALEEARATQNSLDSLGTAAAEGLDVVRVSPFRRRHRPSLQAMSSVVEPLDRAARNIRVMLRRLLSATTASEPLPTELLDLVEELSHACAVLAGDLAAERPMDAAYDALDRVARLSALVPRSSLSGDVVLAQVRSAVVDLFQAIGLPPEEAIARVPAARSAG